MDYQVLVQGDTTQKYFPMNESIILLLIYQVKMVSSLAMAGYENKSIDRSINQSENIERNL